MNKALDQGPAEGPVLPRAPIQRAWRCGSVPRGEGIFTETGGAAEGERGRDGEGGTETQRQKDRDSVHRLDKGVDRPGTAGPRTTGAGAALAVGLRSRSRDTTFFWRWGLPLEGTCFPLNPTCLPTFALGSRWAPFPHTTQTVWPNGPERAGGRGALAARESDR